MPSPGIAHPAIRTVSVEAPTEWLHLGWRDLRRAGVRSVGYGLLFVVTSWVLVLGLLAGGMGSMVLPLAGGFLLVGPFLAVGLYGISRDLDAGRPPSLTAVLGGLRPHADQLALMGLVLVGVQMVWTLVALALFALFFHQAPPPLETFLVDILANPDNVAFLVLGTAVGGVLAGVIFTISVVSLPMLLDRDVSAVTAIVTSVAAVRANAAVMVSWAATIVVLVAVGMATAFLGFAIIVPVIGHATWHAYRALVAPEGR